MADFLDGLEVAEFHSESGAYFGSIFSPPVLTSFPPNEKILLAKMRTSKDLSGFFVGIYAAYTYGVKYSLQYASPVAKLRVHIFLNGAEVRSIDVRILDAMLDFYGSNKGMFINQDVKEGDTVAVRFSSNLLFNVSNSGFAFRPAAFLRFDYQGAK